MALPLLISVFVVATCGLIYELVAGTVASYLLGDSVMQFSTVIGTYLFAMGVGSYLSRFLERNLLAAFIKIEILVGLIGGSSAAILFLAFEHVSNLTFILYPLVFLIGLFIGLEIPLLLRILKDRLEFRDLVSKVLSFDYVGALVASILFPLILAPYLGLMRTSFLFGIANVTTGLWILLLFWEEVPGRRALQSLAFTSLAFLLFGFAYSGELMAYAESVAYPQSVIYSKSTPYQRIVLTKSNTDLRLYLNGHLQFSSRDEYRYHEALVHPVMQRASQRGRVLILGGGDGLGAREVLRYPEVQEITLVDLDPAITKLFGNSEMLRTLNADSLRSDRLKVVNADAFTWVRARAKSSELNRLFDVVIVDLPDPTNFSLGKMYTASFYSALRELLATGGAITIQSTSPLFARKSFWCVVQTLEASGFSTVPYHVYVPSFGEWGFVLGTADQLQETHPLTGDYRYLSAVEWQSAQHFPADMARLPTEINRLDNQSLVHYYDEEWGKLGF